MGNLFFYSTEHADIISITDALFLYLNKWKENTEKFWDFFLRTELSNTSLKKIFYCLLIYDREKKSLFY